VVERGAFDAMMCEAAFGAGTAIMAPVHLVAIDHADDGRWALRGRSSCGEVLEQTRFVVDARGRTAVVATKIGARSRRTDALVGLVWRLERSSDPAPTLIEATPHGW
jgi:flavin-dependent dehydrogenase